MLFGNLLVDFLSDIQVLIEVIHPVLKIVDLTSHLLPDFNIMTDGVTTYT